jgi:hypothetical protein
MAEELNRMSLQGNYLGQIELRWFWLCKTFRRFYSLVAANTAADIFQI